MIVVSDTSPILNLARIGRLELLPGLYGQEVFIPAAVHAEITTFERELHGLNIDSLPWLKVADVKDRERVRTLTESLDPGEAEAIVLAIQLCAQRLLVDERLARRTATAAGICVTGLLGVIARAKRAGLIAQAKPVLDDLINIARFWVGAELYWEFLREMGEAE